MLRLVTPALVLVAAASVASAQANPLEQPIAGSQAGQLPVVDWMKPGMRLTYYTSKGTSDTWGVTLVPDENGQWMDKDHPDRKYKEEQVIGMDRQPGVNFQGGYGARQNDIVAVTPEGAIAVDAKLYIMRPDLNALVLQPGGIGTVGTLEAGPSLWIHPRKLAAMLADHERVPNEPGATTRVYRAPFASLDGKQKFDAVRIVTVIEGGHLQQTYDLASGVMLLESSVTSTYGTSQATIVDVNTGVTWQGKRRTSSNYTRFIGMRQLKVAAGADAAPMPPLFTQRGRQFVWQGGFKMQSNLDPALDAQIPPQPSAFAGRVEQPGRGFALMTIVDVTPGAIPPIRPDTRVVGPADVGGLIMAPATVANLRPGATIDEDPITRNRTVYTGPGPDGLLGVEEQGPAHRFVYGYEPQTGLMRRMWFTFGNTGMFYSYQFVER